MIDTKETLGQIASTHPAAMHVFLRHRLDFCCGGAQKFTEACHTAGLDPNEVASEIAVEAEGRPVARWDTKPLPEVISFILNRYHEPLRRDLSVLTEAAARVERVHGKKPSCPRGLTECLVQFDAELREHMSKEEQVLFPAILAGGRGAQLHMPIRVMLQEHDDHGANLRRLRELTTQFIPPPEACATWRALYSGLDKLESELMEHIHLENNVLFPRALNG
jgi:regulator of cell morphogenesis and NO signaling